LLTVTSNTGCIDTTEKCFEIYTDYTFYIPNSFSPNNDGKNDEFYCKGEGVMEFKMDIFDRWGTIVFTTTDMNQHWDGKPLKGARVAQQDSYVYDIVTKDIYKERHQYTGNIIIVR
jgi:gliding motility-associated-like protein